MQWTVRPSGTLDGHNLFYERGEGDLRDGTHGGVIYDDSLTPETLLVNAAKIPLGFLGETEKGSLLNRKNQHVPIIL